MSAYHHLFENPDTGEPLARVRYRFDEGDSLIIEETIPAGFDATTEARELELRLHAARIDEIEAEREPDIEPAWETRENANRPFHWGVKG